METRRDLATGQPSLRRTGAASPYPASARLPVPAPHDHVILLRGLPVAPWMQLRPAAEVWAVWLARLREVVLGQQPAPYEIHAASRGGADPADPGWQAWYDAHVHSVQAGRVEEGVAALARLLRHLGAEHGAEAGEGPEAGAHLVGHSVGGAVVLAYVAGLRAGANAMPAVRLRAALTLDAAVAGLAGAWSGAKVHLARVTGERVMGEGLRGLNAWALERGIRLLTATNERDAWSHRTLADLPYLGVRLGPRFTLRGQVNGTVHGWLRRSPEFVRAIWAPEGEDAVPAPPWLLPPA